jgi:hypothetical protein
MASGHANRANTNTWLHRPAMRRDVLTLPTRSRPHMALSGHRSRRRCMSALGAKRTFPLRSAGAFMSSRPKSSYEELSRQAVLSTG